MKIFDSTRHALTICAVATVLSACSQSSQPPIGAPGAMPGATMRTQHQAGSAKSLLKLLYSFTGSPDGAEPESGLVTSNRRDAPHYPRMIGTTFAGGGSNNDGTVYYNTPDYPGNWNVGYAFKGVTYGDGSGPLGIYSNPKELKTDGSFYVTTTGGGLYGAGAVVALTPATSASWTERVLYSFASSPDGDLPQAAVVADKAGNLYGTTTAGGTYGEGTVYRLQPHGSKYTESVLYSFEGGSDGARPYAALIIDKAGSLYGTTKQGGGSNGYGTVFKLTRSGSGYAEAVIHEFQGPPYDGANPIGGLAPSDGSLEPAAGGKVIGMSSGGGNQGEGIVYELTPAGKTYSETILWNFGSISGDGANPSGTPLVSKKGVIYGTTLSGGSQGSGGLGTFFILMPSGSTYKDTVYTFTGANGANPYAGPSVDSKGHVYVTTPGGGKNNHGAVVGVAHVIVK
jgi:uncharacterized repeat protein (TIGR03803 family)